MGRIASCLAWALLVGCERDREPQAASTIDEADAPTEVAAAVCAAEHDCTCPEPQWPDRDTCQASERQRMEDAAAIADQHDLAYDGECVARRVTAYADAGCEAEVELLEQCTIACRPYFGTAREGEPCERLAITVDIDTCAQGLRCEQGTCVQRCEATPLAEGAACAAGVEVLGECAAELYCAPSGRCAPRPEAGEACPDDACVSTAWCDRSDPTAPICRERVGAGEACTVDSECESDRCEADGCAPLPAAACSYGAL